MTRKILDFDDNTFAALKLLASDRMSTLQELADEAFADLLRKHGRPTEAREAFRMSLAAQARKVGARKAGAKKLEAKKPGVKPARRRAQPRSRSSGRRLK